MRICLDTSGYSAFKRGHPDALELVSRSSEIVLSATVLGELEAGFRLGSRGERNRRELEEFRRSPRTRVVSVDEETAVCYAEILTALRKAGTPIPANDAWIAATAMQYGLRMVTADRDFVRVPQIAVDLITP